MSVVKIIIIIKDRTTISVKIEDNQMESTHLGQTILFRNGIPKEINEITAISWKKLWLLKCGIEESEI